MRQTRPAFPQFLSISELAERMDVSTKTIRRWIKAGEIRTHKLGRQIRVTEEDAHSFVLRRRG